MGSDRIVIVAEHTPDPDTLRFDAGRKLAPGSPVEFHEPETARSGSPLAGALFEQPGVCSVLIGSDFVAVRRDSAVPWPRIAEPLMRILEAYLLSGQPVFSQNFAQPHDPQPLAAQIQRILAEEIRPAVARDGGDVAFVSYQDGVLELDLHGACAHCPAASLTLSLRIEARLQQELPEIRKVVAARGDPAGGGSSGPECPPIATLE